jgi:hypothetical protein
MMGIFILDIFGKLNNLSLLNSDPAYPLLFRHKATHNPHRGSRCYQG